MEAQKLSSSWKALRHHPVQQQYFTSRKRFNIVPAGRRGGKTEIAKRRAVRKAIGYCSHPDGWVVLAAPTHGQAKRIYWGDVKRLVPKVFVRAISEGELAIYLFNGIKLQVMGLDVPERIEGPPLDHIVMDEYGNMKEDVWGAHVRPSLSDRQGTADFIGVPEGRNHYYELWKDALTNERWGAFTWTSEEILPPDEIDEAKRDLDTLTYDQEYRAHFVTFQGRTYYAFLEDANVHPLSYNRERDLFITMDFNVAPGTANAIQEFKNSGQFPGNVAEQFSGVIGEVHIQRDSNTPRVCDRLLNAYGEHEGEIYIYGDATGGAKGTAKVKGSDWDIAKGLFRARWGDRAHFRVPKGNPKERVRVNAVNSRCATADGTVKLLVDPRCQRTIEDFNGVRNKKDGSGEIDKKADPHLSHLTDGVGYYIAKRFPIAKGAIAVVEDY